MPGSAYVVHYSLLLSDYRQKQPEYELISNASLCELKHRTIALVEAQAVVSI